MDRKKTLLIVVFLILSAAIAYSFLDFKIGDDAQRSLHVEQATEAEIDGSIIEYANMTEDQQRVFRTAVTQGSSPIPSSVDYEIWIDNRGARFENQTYSTAVGVSD